MREAIDHALVRRYPARSATLYMLTLFVIVRKSVTYDCRSAIYDFRSVLNMKLNKPKNARAHDRAKHRAPWKSSAALVVAFAVIVLATASNLFWPRQQPETESSAARHGARPNSSADSSLLQFQILKGQWLRPDGGYIIDISKIESGGKMQAGYYNPRPIRIAKAQAGQEGATATVFIELDDVGYPGSTYTLRHDPASDQLQGVYYQAALQQSFEVVFVRMK